MSVHRAAGWTPVCELERLEPERGVAALVDSHQVALFRLDSEPGAPPEVVGVANRDPFSGANVISRGVIGSAGTIDFVASPMFKDRFDLRSGQCLADADVRIPVWDVRIVDGVVAVRGPLFNDR